MSWSSISKNSIRSFIQISRLHKNNTKYEIVTTYFLREQTWNGFDYFIFILLYYFFIILSILKFFTFNKNTIL